MKIQTEHLTEQIKNKSGILDKNCMDTVRESLWKQSWITK